MALTTVLICVVPVFWLKFVWADQLGSGNGLRFFFGGVWGHISRWFPGQLLKAAGRSPSDFPWLSWVQHDDVWVLVEQRLRKHGEIPQTTFNICRFSDWRLPNWLPIKGITNMRKLYLRGVPKKIESGINLKMPNILSPLEISFKSHGIKMPIKITGWWLTYPSEKY